MSNETTPKAASLSVKELAAKIKAQDQDITQAKADLLARAQIVELKIEAAQKRLAAAQNAKKAVAKALDGLGAPKFRREEGRAKIMAGGLVVMSGVIKVDREAKTVAYAPPWDEPTLLGVLLAAGTHGSAENFAGWKAAGQKALDTRAKATKAAKEAKEAQATTPTSPAADPGQAEASAGQKPTGKPPHYKPFPETGGLALNVPYDENRIEISAARTLGAFFDDWAKPKFWWCWEKDKAKFTKWLPEEGV